MIFKNYQWRIISRVLSLLATLSLGAFLIVNGKYIFLMLLLPVVIYQVLDILKFMQKAQDEVNQFVESVHYRDFSRYFDVKHAPIELQPLRKGFNEINSTFKVISNERETQYHYLQKILELVDTGILSYETVTGEVSWMNESLKKMLGIPYLKTIQSLEKRDNELFNQVSTLKPGENKVVSIYRERNNIKTLLSATAFKTDGHIFKLIAFQNVNEALDENEAKAWQKLLSVMTHEIMNSVAPISSLADTLKKRLQNAVQHFEEQPSTVEDLELGIDTIKRRSEGLLKFAETYRNLNKITSPTLKRVYVRDLFENLHHLMQPTLEQKNVELEIILKDPNLTLEVDTNLIEQVLINLLVNALEAVKDADNPKITLSGYVNGIKKSVISISDNGTGMTQAVMENIFIPFFSTKKTGSGIGLSLCKQIMMLHKGTIQVQSEEGQGSVFLLQF